MGSNLLIINFSICAFIYIFMNRFYEGHFPVLVTSDLELIQEIFIKKFNYFSPRKVGQSLLATVSGRIELMFCFLDESSHLVG
jgi:hypothetical protein